MKQPWQDWPYAICGGLIGGAIVGYAYFKIKLLIDIWRAVCR